MAVHRLAAVLQISGESDQVLVVRQTPPPQIPGEEYSKYVDSDLWDLPSAPLNLYPPHLQSASLAITEGSDSFTDRLDLRLFDVDSALDQVLSLGRISRPAVGHWVLFNYMEEADFGPEPLVHTVFLLGVLKVEEKGCQGVSKWMSIHCSLELLQEVKSGNDRLGPLVVTWLLNKTAESRKWKVPQTLRHQEYPLGLMLVPMRSRTQVPFRTTNLVIVAPGDASSDSGALDGYVFGDALIVDPGCHIGCHAELEKIVAALPRRLVVFVTHHHRDHVDGLSVIQKSNPGAILLAHENTMRRVRKDNWSLGYKPVSGGETIHIGHQRLQAIFASGHTDGHMALLHVNTNSIIVGDHCVGHGSSLLDISSGGSMKDYFQTTYNILDLSPHVIIPMHGRFNLWPKRMLCGYLKHRRDRELAVLRAINNGAETLFDIVAKLYADIDTKLWDFASSNVRLHVEYLVHQDKLPEGFSIKNFQETCGLRFYFRWLLVHLKSKVFSTVCKCSAFTWFTYVIVVGFAILIAAIWKFVS